VRTVQQIQKDEDCGIGRALEIQKKERMIEKNIKRDSESRDDTSDT